jgi:dihydroflavonol-4-reductase
MILVTGGTGHIGNVLIRTLKNRGEKVRALVLPGEDLRPLSDLDVEVVEGDVLQPQTLDRAMSGVTKAYHLAGIISILPGRNELLRRVNIQGTINVVQSALRAGVRRVVYTSSIHAIARVPRDVVVDESVPFDPHNPFGEYDRSKAEASLAVQEAVAQGLDAVIVCPTGVIGPYDYRVSEIGQVILGCVEEKPQFYVDGGYDFVDVRDVAEGLILAGEHGRCGETYILSGEQLSVDRLLGEVEHVTQHRLHKLRIPISLARFASRFSPAFYRLTHSKPRFTSYSLEVLEDNPVISHAKAERELGYRPRSLKITLADTVEWFRANRKNLTPVNLL